MNTVIVELHGMGWVQEDGTPKFGNDLLAALTEAYPGAEINARRAQCPTSKLGMPPSAKPPGVIQLRHAAPQSLLTDDPALSLEVDDLGCLDQTVITLPKSDHKITVYRYLWSDAMWDYAEGFALGYDPPFAKWDKDHRGYDDLNRSRAWLNKKLKAALVTYGFDNATLYLGPLGSAIRDGIQASLCIAVSGEFDNLATPALRQPSVAAVVRTDSVCSAAAHSQVSLLLISRSLGSRILFDTLVTDLKHDLSVFLSKSVANDVIELHMLANQIPLEALGRLRTEHHKEVLAGKSLRLIAYSDVDDLLTYELVPYFEQLYYYRCKGASPPKDECECPTEGRWDKRFRADFGCENYELQRRREDFSADTTARRRLVDSLGFDDVVDVRLQLAPGVWIFRDPITAHGGQLKYSVAKTLLVCGAKEGVPRASWEDCRAMK